MARVFSSRLVAPNATDKNWVHVSKGGLNPCLLIKENSVLPNCVGYAWGRWHELLGTTPALSQGNAENWWAKADGYKRGSVPLLGAVACWRKGLAGDSSDGAGHVAIVEQVNMDGTIVTSNSSYLGSNFYMRTIKPPYNIGALYTFQGFIYLPIEFAAIVVEPRHPIDQIAKEVINGQWGTGATRKAALTTAGYIYLDVQKKVNELLTKKIVVPRKTVEQIAREVIAGKWSVGLIRKIWLKAEGYDPDEVQKVVNQILAPAKPRKTVDQIAREVIAGKWGSGTARKSALIAAGYDYKLVQTKVNNILK
jgi:hypothetical protein